MFAIEWTMFVGRFRLVARETSATIGDRIAIDVLEEWPAAIRDSAIQYAQVTALAEGGAGGPIGMGRQNRNAPELRRRRFGGGLT